MFKKGIQITILFIIANVGQIVYYASVHNLDSVHNWDLEFNIWIYSASMFVKMSLTGVAHWIFSYEYYNMVRLVPFVLDDL